MKNFVIFLGGSGSMAAKAFAHFVALGLVDVPVVNVQLCDMDAESADTRSAKELLSLVSGVSAAGAIRPIEGNGVCDEKYLFPTPLVRDEFDLHDSFVKIARYHGIGMGMDADLPIDNCLLERPEDDLLLHAFFTKREQQESTLIGFKGDAARAATVYAYMLEHNCGVLEQIENEIAANKAEHIRVFVVGSVFGGTGASMFLKTAEKLRELDATGTHIHIGGALMLPSFDFAPRADCDVRSTNFWGQTERTLELFAGRDDLVKRHAEDQERIFDRLYLAVLPNNELHHTTANACEGGRDQRRVSGLIDVITANYITDFFNMPVSDENGFCCAAGTREQPCSNIYTFNYPQNVDYTPMELSAIPYGFGNQAVVMLVFSSMVFYMRWQLMNERNPRHIVWLKDLFGRAVRRQPTEILTFVPAALEDVYRYCCEFVEFIYQFSQTGKPQDPNQNDYSSHYTFFDQTAINLIRRIKKKLMNGDPVTGDEMTQLMRCDRYRSSGPGLRKTARDCLHNSMGRRRLSNNTSDDIDAAVCAYLNNAYAYLQDCEQE